MEITLLKSYKLVLRGLIKPQVFYYLLNVKQKEIEIMRIQEKLNIENFVLKINFLGTEMGFFIFETTGKVRCKVVDWVHAQLS